MRAKFLRPRPLSSPMPAQSRPKEWLWPTSTELIQYCRYRALPHMTLVVYGRLFIAEATFRMYHSPPVGLRPIMYYTACLLLTIQWQLLCQAIVGLVYKWEGLLKIVWGGCNPLNPPPLDPPLQREIYKYSICTCFWHIWHPIHTCTYQTYMYVSYLL